MNRYKFVLWVVSLLIAAPALAHGGHAESWGLATGLAHPFGGADHLLAAFAVGFWAAAQRASRRWLAPAAFVVLMSAAAVTAHAWDLPAPSDAWIAGSVLALGLLILGASRLPAPWAVALIGVFALVHGAAHGAEAAEAVGSAYFAGLALSTAALHLSGLAVGTRLRRHAVHLSTGAGIACSLAGAYLLASI